MASFLKFSFLGDSKDLEQAADKSEKALKGVGDAAEKQQGKLGKMADGLGGVSKIAGGFVLGSGLLAAPGFLLGAAQAAADDEQATARLQQTVKNLGGDYDGLMGKVNSQIDAGQKLAFSDDEVRDSFQYLAQATNDADEAMRRQKIAMDLSRGANISLDAASKMLGKTSEENINTLKKLGIEVAEGASEADVLAGVQARFAGQADAFASSTAGQFAQAKLAMGEIVEGIGGAVLPILSKVGTVVAANLPAIQAFVGGFAEQISGVLIPVIEGAVAFIGPKLREAGEFFVTEIMPRVDAFMTWLGPKMRELGEWIAVQFEKFSQYYESDIKPALDNIMTGVGKVIDFVAEHWPEIERVILPILKIVSNAVELNVKIIMTAFGVLIDLLGGDFSGAWKRIENLVGEVWETIKENTRLGIEVVKNLAPLMLEAGKAVGGALMDGLKGALSAGAGFAGDVAGAVLEAVKRLINSQVIDPLNRTLEFGFDTHIPGVGTVNINPPDIPRLAAGGIVTRPTVALIGEAGPEAVIPLSSANARGGSLLGIGLGGALPISGITSSASLSGNLSSDLLKKIAEHTDRAAKELDNQEGFLAATSKAVHAGGGTKAGDLLAQIAEAQEVLPELWMLLRDIRDKPAGLVTVVVNAATSDPDGLAKELAPALARYLAEYMGTQWEAA